MSTAEERSRELVSTDGQPVDRSVGRPRTEVASDNRPPIAERRTARFGNLKERIDGISGKVLSESLTDLEEQGIGERRVLETKPVRVEYPLTSAGRG
ncbi:winged helix-turn-helix transcriptional regulator [Natronococcus occultus]|uniref:winged helix-turn-helix transcriptional regulator n=1 Tax=Natronococcus occultus TaxID=29288 RepID=UPI001FE0A91E|nr:winged helix-turn-helix transcriptional regulator [Natronococcus occultus]